MRYNWRDVVLEVGIVVGIGSLILIAVSGCIIRGDDRERSSAVEVWRK